MSGQLHLRIGQHSVAGRKSENQDALGIRYPEGDALRFKGVCAAIADGVTASRAGREAAEACVKGFLNDYYSTPDTWSVEKSSGRVLGALNRWLHGRGFEHANDGTGMVCTFSAVVIKSNQAYVFHVGDSRVSLLRKGRLEPVTRDHNVLVGRERHALSRAMGVEPNVEIDVARICLQAGDRLILSTDGVHGYLSAGQMATLSSADTAEWAARGLVNGAFESGSTDNLSAQVLIVDHLPAEDLEDHYRRLTELPFPPPLEAGQKLDGYRVIREVHASTRSQVYLAEPESGGEQVIIKTPSPNYSDDPAYIDRFMIEAWAARRLNSAHIVRFLEPPADRQCLYSLTEYVCGPTLREWMNDQCSPELSVVRDIVRQIAYGLRAMHRLDMVHQDLKPENIVIDQDGTVKIIDLGAVRIRGFDQIQVPWQRNTCLGTENYAAPELLAGEASTPASDRYSLGVIAYELFTGRTPYSRPPLPSVSARLRYRSAREVSPDLPAWLDACLEKAVAINPSARYPALSEFLRDLEYPNNRLLPDARPPLVERVPPDRWRFIAVISLLFNLILLLAFLLG